RIELRIQGKEPVPTLLSQAGQLGQRNGHGILTAVPFTGTGSLYVTKPLKEIPPYVSVAARGKFDLEVRFRGSGPHAQMPRGPQFRVQTPSRESRLSSSFPTA